MLLNHGIDLEQVYSCTKELPEKKSFASSILRAFDISTLVENYLVHQMVHQQHSPTFTIRKSTPVASVLMDLVLDALLLMELECNHSLSGIA